MANLTQEELRSFASNSIRTTLFERVYEAYEEYRRQNNVSDPIYAQVAVPEMVTETQTEMAVDEFIGDYPEIKTQDEVVEAVRDYIDENYDADFLQAQMENQFDEDVAGETAFDELSLILGNTEPYAEVDENYWRRKVQGANLRGFELAKYATEDGVHAFVEEHAPEWRSESSEV